MSDDMSDMSDDDLFGAVGILGAAARVANDPTRAPYRRPGPRP